MPPVASEATIPPQGLDVRAALMASMRRHGYSARGLARELQRRHPRKGGDEKGIESWRVTIGRYLTPSEKRRQVPDKVTAALIAEVLDEDPDAFFRRPGRKTRRERALEQENEQLRAEIAEYQRRLEAAAQAGDENP